MARTKLTAQFKGPKLAGIRRSNIARMSATFTGPRRATPHNGGASVEEMRRVWERITRITAVQRRLRIRLQVARLRRALLRDIADLPSGSGEEETEEEEEEESTEATLTPTEILSEESHDEESDDDDEDDEIGGLRQILDLILYN